MIKIGKIYTKSPIPWVGGKAMLREPILMSVPLGCDRYIEVFGGGGTILLSKEPHKFEVYNDFNSDLVNFFVILRDMPLSFFKAAGLFPLNSREEFKILRDFLSRTEPDFSIINNETELAETIFLDEEEKREINTILQGRTELYNVDRAVAFYKTIRYSYGGSGKNFGGQPTNLANALEHIYSVYKRLQNVVIENKDFASVIKQYDRPGSFFYADPPYVDTEGHYQVEFTRNDHERLCDVLHSIKGKYLLSYNDCEYIKEMYSDCYIVEVSRLNSLAQRYSAGSEFKELLIANYDINERRKTMPVQLSLFEGEEYYERDYLLDYRNKGGIRRNNYSYYIPYSLKDKK